MGVVYKQVHEIFECSVHMTDEHSTLDNCWCYVYEHLVSNQKNRLLIKNNFVKLLIAGRIHQLDFAILNLVRKHFQSNFRSTEFISRILVFD